MRVPLSWLREYVTFDLSPRELAEELTMRGMEVKSVETSGADWTDVVVGELLTVEQPRPAWRSAAVRSRAVASRHEFINSSSR